MKKLELYQMENLEGGKWTSSCTWGLIGAVGVGLALAAGPLGWLALSSVLVSGVATEAALIKCIKNY